MTAPACRTCNKYPRKGPKHLALPTTYIPYLYPTATRTRNPRRAMTLNHSEIESAGLRILEHICEYDQNLKAGEKTGDQVSRIVTACRELEALVTPSQVWNLQIATAHHRASVMCMLLDWKIPQILSEASGAMSLGELSKASGVAEPLLRMYFQRLWRQKYDVPYEGLPLFRGYHEGKCFQLHH